MKKNILFLLIVLCQIQFTYSQVVIHIESLADNTPEDAEIYFAGNINGWDPGDNDFKLEKRNDGDYWIDLAAGSGTVEFKFTRGSWASVESNGNGGYRPNRSFNYANTDTLHLNILGWEDLDGSGPNSTANDQVQILDESMYMPQLGRSRRIWVYLPKDYETTNKSYPVLYMHDGQNVFDAYTSFAGEWEVDETLTELEENGFRGLIVVAIDNGGAHRIDEYSPFSNPQYGGGDGDKYLDFLIHTLKPRIDTTFRTLTEARYTGIMGSSMGGLISHYAHFRNPEVFGRAGIFSPAFWFSDEYFNHTLESGKTDNARIFLYAGEKEWSILTGSTEMFGQLTEMGYSEEELRYITKSDGEHAEYYWAREFGEAVRWLFENTATLDSGKRKWKPVNIYPNPAKDTLFVTGEGEFLIRVFNQSGKLLAEETIINSGTISLHFTNEANVVFVQILQNGESFWKRLIIVD